MREQHSPEPEPESPFLTPREVAEMLKISLPTLQRRLRDGTIPGMCFGGRIWRCRRDQIMALGLEPKDK